MNKNEIYREYRKQRKRIQSFIRRAEKRGFVFENPLPPIPKKITEASIRRLSKLTPKALYKKAKYASEETSGEIVSGTKGRNIERRRAAKKAAKTRKRKVSNIAKRVEKPESEIIYTNKKRNSRESGDLFTRIIITNYKRHISQFNEKAYMILLRWLEKLIEENGIQNTAKMLEDGANSGLIVNYKVVYSDTALTNYMAEMLNYLPDSGHLYREQFMEAMEEEEWLTMY